jgi:hypothetical protein
MDRVRQLLFSVAAAAILIAGLSAVPGGRVAAQQTIRDQEYAARNAVQAAFGATFLAGSQSFYPVPVYTVPAMKRLVVENVSFTTTLPVGENLPSAVLATTIGGSGPLDHGLVISPQGTDAFGKPVFASNTSTRLYADAGTTVHFQAFRTRPVRQRALLASSRVTSSISHSSPW